MFNVLAINIGSTTTKVGIHKKNSGLIRYTFSYESDLENDTRSDPERRKQDIYAFLETFRVNHGSIQLIVSRGGLGKPGPSGVYRINKQMCDDLMSAKYGWHPSALGPVIAYEMAQSWNIDAVVVDPPSTDEFDDRSRFSGHPDIERKSAFHALNQKSAAIKAAKDLGRSYADCNFVVAHMGGGITIGAHRLGRVIDATHGLAEGPFTPERAGTLPTLDLAEFIRQKKLSGKDLQVMLCGGSGLYAYLGTKDATLIEEMIDKGNHAAEQCYQAMAYQIAKEIGAMAAVLKGTVDAVVLTGGLAKSKLFTSWISDMTGFVAQILVYPGEDEIQALIDGGFRVLQAEESVQLYPP